MIDDESGSVSDVASVFPLSRTSRSWWRPTGPTGRASCSTSLRSTSTLRPDWHLHCIRLPDRLSTPPVRCWTLGPIPFQSSCFLLQNVQPQCGHVAHFYCYRRKVAKLKTWGERKVHFGWIWNALEPLHFNGPSKLLNAHVQLFSVFFFFNSSFTRCWISNFAVFDETDNIKGIVTTQRLQCISDSLLCVFFFLPKAKQSKHLLVPKKK